jgi:hypothetical protein
VRTSATEVDRRHSHRHAVNLSGRLTLPGQGTHSGVAFGALAADRTG